MANYSPDLRDEIASSRNDPHTSVAARSSSGILPDPTTAALQLPAAGSGGGSGRTGSSRVSSLVLEVAALLSNEATPLPPPCLREVAHLSCRCGMMCGMM